MVAGEASGDLLAAHLMAAIKQRLPGVHFMGIGGPRMQAEGFDVWWPGEKLAVRGYVEVLRHYPEITGIRRKLAQRLLAQKPDLFIGVDAPDFNLDLEIRLRETGIATCHYVSPSIWAWRGNRMDKIRRAAGHMLCLFPFEQNLYAKAQVPASYVGHPLADMIGLDAGSDAARSAARATLGLPQDAPVVALLPGSRESELRYLSVRFAHTALLMAAARPQLHFVVPFASVETEAQWHAAQTAAGLDAAQAARFTLVQRASHTALAACDVALVASGTATLETALLRRPMVIAYNMAPLSWAMMRRMKYQSWVGLPNILCGEFVVPEFLQDEASPENLAQALLNLLDDHSLRTRIAGRFDALHRSLRQDSAARAADAVERLLRAPHVAPPTYSVPPMQPAPSTQPLPPTHEAPPTSYALPGLPASATPPTPPARQGQA